MQIRNPDVIILKTKKTNAKTSSKSDKAFQEQKIKITKRIQLPPNKEYFKFSFHEYTPNSKTKKRFAEYEYTKLKLFTNKL